MSNTCPKNPDRQCMIPGPTPDGRCCRIHPVGEPTNFSVHRRNPGHWDITTNFGRAFRIRGTAPNVCVHDERDDGVRPFPRDSIPFTSVAIALAWCAEALMHEPQA